MLRQTTRLLGRVSQSQREELIRQLHREPPQIQHDKDTQTFYLKIGEDKALIEYDQIDKNTLDLHHTEVPDVFQGRGIAKILAKGTFDYCVKNDLKMKLTCTYLQKFYEDNKQEYDKYISS